jgi:hypothetical protein
MGFPRQVGRDRRPVVSGVVIERRDADAIDISR